MAATAGSPEYRDAGGGIRDARDAAAPCCSDSLASSNRTCKLAPLAARPWSLVGRAEASLEQRCLLEERPVGQDHELLSPLCPQTAGPLPIQKGLRRKGARLRLHGRLRLQFLSACWLGVSPFWALWRAGGS